ncbi:hypothetical protein GUITHDRAFT_164767 [Guillardia theta CCMP2712]|uniref:MYND-type domain-containing protein n=1 Tax=Guillardia theta (strain CCMP2712) TaxID=905079 RepID=L1IVZ9_GUITC|nr:hypothetical protein GUITHDRAFT_164767 [Guillardia theta CCMP2712]EKX40069.1 hypothetical protein GUITHDRAFT_164767 [Guillardia theta CCMP2712]|eukprot:XP_005827049.1 hypothetical protein GUITHDRAFT_164767 [Guillardia theta CCMP2712]
MEMEEGDLQKLRSPHGSLSVPVVLVVAVLMDKFQHRDAYLERSFSVGVRSTENKGSHLVALKAFRPGDTVLRSRPYAFEIFPELREERCNECFRRPAEGISLLRCSSCKITRYCGKECQARAWKRSHKYECSLQRELEDRFGSLPSSVYIDVTIIIRIAILLMSGKAVNAMSSDDYVQDHDDVKAMIDHMAQMRKSNAQEFAGNQEIVRIAEHLLDMLQARSPKGLDWSLKPTEEELLKVLCKFACNNFSHAARQIWDDLIVSHGMGVYPLGAILNHSCKPNCVIYYHPETHEQEFRCIEDIQVGEDICHSYIDLAAVSKTRKEKLQSTYYFDCDCQCCKFPEELDNKLGARDGKVTEKCDRAAELLAAAGSRTEIEHALSRLKDLDENVLADRGNVDLDRLSVKSKMLQASIELGMMDSAIRACKQVVEGYRGIYPPLHPLLGLQLYTLGNLLFDDGRGEEAADVLQEGQKILLATHDRRSTMVQGITELLAEARKVHR